MSRLQPTAVVKFGGSLLRQANLRKNLRELLELVPARSVWIAGGGAAADVVRDWDRMFGLGDVVSHELALTSMRLTGELLSRLIPQARLVTTAKDVEQAWMDSQVPILDAEPFLASMQLLTEPRLPASWESTSDSLAGLICEALRADWLILMKSTSGPFGESCSNAAMTGLVDGHLERFVGQIPAVYWVNGLTASKEMHIWLRHGVVASE